MSIASWAQPRAAGPRGTRFLEQLKALSVDGRVRLASAKVGGETLRAVSIEASLVRGVLEVREARAGVFGGTLDGHGTRLDLSGASPRFSLRASASDIDLAAIPRGDDSTVEELRGRGGFSAAFDGEGTTAAELRASLRGDARVRLGGVHLKSEQSIKSKLVNPVLAGLSAKPSRRHTETVTAVDLSELTAALHVEGGSVTTNEPIRLVSTEGTMTLDGRFGLDGATNLRGELSIPPGTIDRATGGKVVPLHEIDVRFHVTAKEGKSHVDVLNLMDVLNGFRGSLANARALHL